MNWRMGLKKIKFRETFILKLGERFRDMEFRMGGSGKHLMGLWKKRTEKVGKRQFSRVNG